MGTNVTPLAKCVNYAMVFKADFAPAGLAQLGELLSRSESLEAKNAKLRSALTHVKWAISDSTPERCGMSPDLKRWFLNTIEAALSQDDKPPHDEAMA